MSYPFLPIEVIEHILTFVCGPFSPSSPLSRPAALARRLVPLPLLLVSHGFTSLLAPYLHRSINIQHQDDWKDSFHPERGTLVAGPQAGQRRSWARELRVSDGVAAGPPPSLVLPRWIRLPNLTHLCLTHYKHSFERAPIVWDPTASALAEELERPRVRAYRSLLAGSPNIDTVSLSIAKTWSADLYRFLVRPIVPAGVKVVLYTDPTVSDHDTVRSLLAVHRAGPHEVRLVGSDSTRRRESSRM